jgi:hypothetical protein
MGVVFLAGAIWAFVNPLVTFWALATVIGLVLILQGAVVLITSIESRIINSIWWLGLGRGHLGDPRRLLGLPAAGHCPRRATDDLVGPRALFRGINQIVLAFELKSAQYH